MRHIGHFRSFLRDTVNLDDDRLEKLNARIDTISGFLGGASTIGDIFLGTTAQGSLAHRTIIRPLPDHEVDADILLELVYQNDWLPRDYIEEVYQAFRTDGRFKDRVIRKNRCVRVQYANDMHIDVVPFVEQAGKFYITNRTDGDNGSFERTDPAGYSSWLDDQSRITNGNLIKVIRLMKWLRDYKETFTCRSVILNVLLGDRVTAARVSGDASYYADVPTTLVHLLEDLAEYLEPYDSYMPRISDPTCPELDYNHRWDNEQYLNFRDRIRGYGAKAREALDETDRAGSLKLWQELFGSELGRSTKEFDLSQRASRGDPGEMFIEDSYPIELGPYTFRVSAYAERRHGFRHGPMSGFGNRIQRERSIRFEIERCTVPQPYEVLWKIKNRGREAREANCLRGEIIGGKRGPRTHSEPTRYRGQHYVEAYIIKDGKCVAINRQPVIIV